MALVSTETTEYCNQLVNVLSKLHDPNDTNIKEWVTTNLGPLCYNNVHNYFITQAILTGLSRETENGIHWGQMLNRISQELAAGLGDREEVLMLTEGVKFSGITALDVIEALIGIQRDSKPSGGDIVKLYKHYNSNDPPSPVFLRDAAILNALIADTFVPRRSNAHLEETLWLLAYAVSIVDHDSKRGSVGDDDDFKSTLEALKSLDALTNRITSMAQMQDHISAFLQATERQITSMALLHWVSSCLSNGSFYEWTMLREEIPPAFNLVDEMVIRHPFLWEHATNFWITLLEGGYESQDPLMMIEIKQKILDHLVLLVKVGYAVPVVKYISEHTGSIDESLRTHFVVSILSAIEAPYPKEFSSPLAQIVASLSQELPRFSDGFNLISAFIDVLLNTATEPSDSDLDLLIKLKSRFS
ncbi:hypothetical protein SpCBS45565_g01678 [Spizellomyces sp. 'palustris']|nr:hypothetical protein SpCBS45565_g01678 [Spizellomyces sp. 'palustris']